MFSPQKAHVSSIPIPSSPFLEIISLCLWFWIWQKCSNEQNETLCDIAYTIKNLILKLNSSMKKVEKLLIVVFAGV